MSRSIAVPLVLAMVAALLLHPPAQAANIKDEVERVTSRFRDITATAVVVYANQKELKKMDKANARSLELKKADMTFKAPDKFKMEGALGMVRFVYITNGDMRIVRIPSIRYSKRENASDEPGKLRTCIDIGLVTEHLWAAYHVKPVGQADTPSGEVYVLELVRVGDSSHTQKIWVDAKTLTLQKREKYTKTGRLKVRYIFKETQNVDGVIRIPTRVEMYGPNGALAGITEIRSVRVNSNVPDSVFR